MNQAQQAQLISEIRANRKVIEGFLTGYDRNQAFAFHCFHPPEEVKEHLFSLLTFKANILIFGAALLDTPVSELKTQ